MSTPELMPNLQLVPVAQVRFHEHPERSRTQRLVARLREEALLRNTPIVADMDNGEYLLLDGANRVSAFRELGYSHVPVQVVDYGDERVQLKGWHHLLVNGRSLELARRYRELEGVRLEQVDQERLIHILELRVVYAVLVDEAAACWGLFPAQDAATIEIHERIKIMDQVVSAYEGQSKQERIKLADFSQLPEVLSTVDHQLCLFPVLAKNEMLQLARENVMIPTGLTRHLIPGRALGINLDLKFLNESGGEAELQRRFQEYVERLEMEGRIRYYEESVFIMNE
ncbi:MAG: hypothetical protein O7A08_13150 [SAR324 cluster bacterium]|nr:hypothetical protein [SAR324 cluster bacterium]